MSVGSIQLICCAITKISYVPHLFCIYHQINVIEKLNLPILAVHEEDKLLFQASD